MLDLDLPDLEEVAFAALASAAAIGAAALTRKLLSAAYEKATGKAPPRNPAESDTSWGSALVWGALSGATAGLSRAAARRGSAAAWQAATDDAPPIPDR